MKTKLLNLVSSRKGKKPSAFSQTEKAGFWPYIDIKLFDKGILSRYAKADKKATLVNKQDVLVVWDGARFGLSALGWEGVLGSTIVALQSNYLISKFLYYFLQLNFETIQAKPRGVGIPHVEPSLFWNLPIPVPPMAEQKRIVKKIEELFAVIDRTVKSLNDTKEQLSQYRQSVLQQAFSGKLHKTTEWQKTFLADCCLPVLKRKDSREEKEQFLYLDIASIDNTVNKILGATPYTGKNAPSRARQIIQKGDVLFSTVRTYLKNIALVTEEKYDKQIASTGFCVIRTNPSVLLANFLFYKTLSNDFLAPLNAKQRGSSYPAVRDKDVLSSEIFLPSLPEQKAIVAKIETAFATADKAEKVISAALEQAKQLKQSILKRAFEGKLVPQDPNDEPVDLSQLKTHKGKSK